MHNNIHDYIGFTAKNTNRRGSGDESVITNLEDSLLNILSSPDYRPLNKSELSRTLNVPSRERSELRNLLSSLESKGIIKRIKKGRYVKRGGQELNGTIHFKLRGHAFVSIENSRDDTQVFIPPDLTGTAIHGDKVIIKVQKSQHSPHWTKNIKNKKIKDKLQSRFSETRKSPEGRVIKVLERKNEAVIATYYQKNQFHYAQPDDVLLPKSIELDPNKNVEKTLKNGDKVVISITDWESRRVCPNGHIVKILGSPDGPGIDILQIIYGYKLPIEFKERVIKEAEAFSCDIPEEEFLSREDWRDQPVFTIDPASAKDFDDAILVEKLENGNWQLAVHIADVAYYVKPESELDKEASLRGNSTYLVDRVIPMLPEVLSNGLCSLVPGEDRLTHAAIMDFDSKGSMISVRFCKAIINNSKRFTYEQAHSLLNKPDPQNPFNERLFIAWELAKKLRKRRIKSGALELDMPEIKVILDKKGKPVSIEKTENDESHQLIEEFMLAANEAVAKHLKDKMRPSLFRIHESPDADKLFEFRQLVLSYGLEIGDPSAPNELQKLLRNIRGEVEEHAIKVGLLRSMKRANYSAEPLGHYGLSKTNYTHFTSPIRRYADLIVHRILAAVTGSAPCSTPKLDKLQQLAHHISETERNSSSAEMESQKLKLIEFLWNERKSAKDDSLPCHPAIIHEVRRKGLFIELTDLFIKGLVPEIDFPYCREGYWFDGSSSRFVGSKPKRIFQAGQTIQVIVENVDFNQRLVNFKIIEL